MWGDLHPILPKTTRNKGDCVTWMIPCLLGNICKWNPCLHKIAMGTNKKVVHIYSHLFHFSSFVFTSFRPNHWCKNCLGHNIGYFWIYLLYLLQIIMGRNFDWSTTNITSGLPSNTLFMKRCFIVWDHAFTNPQSQHVLNPNLLQF